MKFMKTDFCCAAFLGAIIALSVCDAQKEQRINDIYQGSENFSLNFFKIINDIVDKDPNIGNNVLVSPFSVWALLTIIAEGAGGNTFTELQNLLNLNDFEGIRYVYKHQLQNALNIDDPEVKIKSAQFVFTDINRPTSSEYESRIENYYGSRIVPVNFMNVKETTQSINRIVKEETQGVIEQAVHPLDMVNAKLVMISTLFFHGQWTSPFNRSFTTKENFYDENEKVVGEVEMMFQRGVFPFAALKEIDSHVLELPYAQNKSLSMLLVMPRKGVLLKQVIAKLVNLKMEKVYQELKNAAAEYEDDEVEVHIPKFTITSDHNLHLALHEMNVNDLFDSTKANLSRMYANSNQIYLSNIYQKAKIIVDEEGTTASSVTAGVFANKATPPRFYANRPFAFLIVEKKLNLILFMGQLKDPLSK